MDEGRRGQAGDVFANGDVDVEGVGGVGFVVVEVVGEGEAAGFSAGGGEEEGLAVAGDLWWGGCGWGEEEEVVDEGIEEVNVPGWGQEGDQEEDCWEEDDQGDCEAGGEVEHGFRLERLFQMMISREQ